jgi:hypothetical protein
LEVLAIPDAPISNSDEQGAELPGVILGHENVTFAPSSSRSVVCQRAHFIQSGEGSRQDRCDVGRMMSKR